MTTIIRLNDGSGKRFVLEKSKKFTAEPYWNGSKHVCGATRKEGEFEELYLTASGRWVMHYVKEAYGKVLVNKFFEISHHDAQVWIRKHVRRYLQIAWWQYFYVKKSGRTRKYSFKKATQYNSDYYYDSQRLKFISKATGVIYEHETLYKTARGRWFIHWTSDVYGVEDKWREVSEDEAKDWLQRNAPGYLQKDAK